MKTAPATRQGGFTLIELLIVVALIGILSSLALPIFKDSQTKAREAVLKENLFVLRDLIDQYYADKGYYPADLQTLVDEEYIRKVPVDPFTGEPLRYELLDGKAVLNGHPMPGIQYRLVIRFASPSN